MANETRTIQGIGTVGEVSASPKATPVRNVLKRAAVFASALLVSGLMLSPMRASAEESKAPQKAGIGVRVGAGYSYKDTTPRALAIVDASVPLPLNSTLSGSVGVSSTSAGAAKWEETNLNLDVPIGSSPLFIDGYIYSSRHFGVFPLSAGADAGVAFPRGAVFAGYEHILRFADLAFAGVKVNAIPGLLSLKFSGSYIPVTESGAVGAGFTLTPGNKGWAIPEIEMHTFVCTDGKTVTFADTVATLGWNF